MSPFRRSLTICTWIKKIFTGSTQPIIFNYWVNSGHEILISATGKYNRVVTDSVLDSSERYFTTPANQWFHYCLSWERSTNTVQLFLDGQLVRSGQTRSSNWRDLRDNGELWFNRLGHDYSDPYYTFGGELFQFNIFSEVLSAASIKKIADGGLCYNLSEFSDSRILKWEDIITKTRSGSVAEINVADTDDAKCLKAQVELLAGKLTQTQIDLDTMSNRLNRTELELETSNSRLNRTEEDLKSANSRLNRTEEDLKSANSRLNRTQEKLETANRNLNRTEEKLATCSATLSDTKQELAGSRRFSNITRWDVLYTSAYHNQVLTEELIERLKSNWDTLSTFVGVNMTDNVVEHFRRHDVEKGDCELEISDVFDMLDELAEGDNMQLKLTRGLIRHFRENHDNVPCETEGTDREIS
ncbi:hypothetical protein ACHWQZ_G004645 [Mnemiopsis leidyi]